MRNGWFLNHRPGLLAEQVNRLFQVKKTGFQNFIIWVVWFDVTIKLGKFEDFNTPGCFVKELLYSQA